MYFLLDIHTPIWYPLISLTKGACPPSLLNAEIGGGEDIWDWEGVVEQRWQDLLTPIAP